MTTSMIAMTEVTVANGKWSRVAKKALLMSAVVCLAMSPPWNMSTWMAVPPKTVNQVKNTTLGTTRTPMMNPRMVRPREMRARKTPTKAPQDTHQAIMK